jgi:hypothetical protein
MSAKKAAAKATKRPMFRVSQFPKVTTSMQSMALSSIEYAWKKSKGDKQEIAKTMKTIFDKQYLPAWHCIVGTSELYVDVRFRLQQCIQITGPVKVVLFKAGPMPADPPREATEPEKPAESVEQKIRLRNPKLLKSAMPAQMEQFCVKCALSGVTETTEHDLQQIIGKMKFKMNVEYGPNWHVAAIKTEHGSGFQDLGFDVDWLDDGFLDMSLAKYRFVIFKYSQEVVLRDFLTTKNISMAMYLIAFACFVFYWHKTQVCEEVRGIMEQNGEDLAHTPDGQHAKNYAECKESELLASQISMVIFVAASVVRFILKLENKREAGSKKPFKKFANNEKEQSDEQNEAEAQGGETEEPDQGGEEQAPEQEGGEDEKAGKTE